MEYIAVWTLHVKIEGFLETRDGVKVGIFPRPPVSPASVFSTYLYFYQKWHL
jgi:hypothetical protein